jgi:hypothetical protein
VHFELVQQAKGQVSIAGALSNGIASSNGGRHQLPSATFDKIGTLMEEGGEPLARRAASAEMDNAGATLLAPFQPREEGTLKKGRAGNSQGR